MNDKKPKTKYDIRSKIFSDGSKARASIKIQFFGTEIELRQATVSQVQGMIDKRALGNGALLFSDYLIDYAYVPGTDEKIFESADRESIAALPFNADMAKLVETITKLTNIDVTVAEKNLPETLSSGA